MANETGFAVQDLSTDTEDNPRAVWAVGGQPHTAPVILKSRPASAILFPRNPLLLNLAGRPRGICLPPRPQAVRT